MSDASAGPAELLEDLRGFCGFGQRTQTDTADGIPYFVNEYWTSAQRKSHPIHEISYRACFKAQLPEFFIQRMTGSGGAVLDPFMGRGTTPVQAGLMGRRALGNDINPLSAMLTRPRLRAVTLDDITRALGTVDWKRGEITRTDLLAFYHPATLERIEALRQWIARRAPPDGPAPDAATDWIRMVALNRLSGHSPGFFSGRSMPPNQAVSVATQEKINARLGITPPERDVAELILRKSASLLRNGPAPEADHALSTGPAWEIPLPDACVDLVVTSPPFLDIVRYADDNWLRCWFAGIDVRSVAIDQHRTEAAWTAMVTRVLAEMARLLRPGSIVAFEVGEVRRGKILLERAVWQAAEGLPFNRLGVMVNAQNFTKTANCWGVENGAKGTNTNRIVLLRRE
ncbi:DNA methyltransferase [Seohaeicola zhoushanensis]|uniref:Methyltransferase n=1 Tax=Seohaeicola zhoushanensis TaxID=1569283 RepID=A0A8J3GWT9_9RHOB|nr:DNA methyltransferase [Seohaeicola zhoushanensis]GHF46007.1 DNA methylase [Seohaeicola zhoushanensis]